MTQERKVLIYGANGYTGKIIAESLAERGIPFYMAGRSRDKLAAAVKVVEERFGGKVDAEIAVACNDPEELRPIFDKVHAVINVFGPFMQIGWPIVETALELNEFKAWPNDQMHQAVVPYHGRRKHLIGVFT